MSSPDSADVTRLEGLVLALETERDGVLSSYASLKVDRDSVSAGRGEGEVCGNPGAHG